MKRVLTAVVLIPLVLLAVLRAPIPLLALIVGVVALLGTREALNMADGYGVHPFRLPTYIFAGIYFVAVGLIGRMNSSEAVGFMIFGAGFAAVIAPFVFLVCGMTRSHIPTAYPAAAASVMTFTYVALPLGLLVQIRQLWAGAILVIYLFIVVWSGDTFAYYIGKAFGRHLLSPQISPKKTWEGAIASVIASAVLGTLFMHYALPISQAFLRWGLFLDRSEGYFALDARPMLPMVLLSIGINIAAQFGDLVESLIKRGAGIKDSGALLPGHGGILDRIDALLLAAPVLWYWAAWRVLA